MIEDRELRREAIKELAELRQMARTIQTPDPKLSQTLVRLIDWIHEHCTD